MKYYEKEMETIHPEGCIMLTWEDAERMEKRNYKNGWGFSMADCLHKLATHMEAQETIDEDDSKAPLAILEQEKIEWRLEDANFHEFRTLLHDNQYIKALAWIAKQFTDLEVVE